MSTTITTEVVSQLEEHLRAVLPPDAVVIEPEAVREASRIWNAEVTAQPLAVVRCASTAEVQVAVRAAGAAGVPLSVRGGGHDWAGSAIRPGGLLIDLSQLRGVDVVGDTAWVGGGATVNDLLDAALEHQQTPVVGTVGSVGVAGLTMGGGYGNLIGTAGLAVDNLLAAEVVLADGRVVTADAQREPDLFWALRGGGGNFGVVTHLRTRLQPLAQVTTGSIVFGWHEARAVLSGLSDVVAAAGDALDIMFAIASTPQGRMLITTPTWSGDPAEAAAQIDRLRALGSPVQDQVADVPLAKVVRAVDGMFPHGGNYHLGSRILPGLDGAGVDAIIAAADAMPASCMLNVHHAHGAALRVPTGATAHAYRDEHFLVEILGLWGGGDGAVQKAWVRETEHRLDDLALPGGWAAFMAADDERRDEAFGANTERLLSVKASYDPDSVFSATPLPRATT